MVTRPQLARLGAPAAFLLGVTVAVLLVRAGLEGGTPTRTSTLGPVTGASTVATATRAGTRTHTRPVVFTGSTSVTAPRYYVVQKGDTFGSIAAKAGTTVTALEALNPGVSSNALQVGQKIRVR